MMRLFAAVILLSVAAPGAVSNLTTDENLYAWASRTILQLFSITYATKLALLPLLC